ncbi:MAG: hypothetical protein ABSF62_22335 [Bryobacteraceae bacterium]
MDTKTKTKGPAKKTARRIPKKRSTVGRHIIEGLEQAIAWTRGPAEGELTAGAVARGAVGLRAGCAAP